MSHRYARPKRAMLYRSVLVIVIGLRCDALLSAGQDARLALLAAADQSVARDMTAFIERMEAKQLGRIAQLNDGVEFERFETSTEDTDYTVRVMRGPVVEKAGTMIAVGRKNQPGRIPGVLLWSRFYSLDVHPRTPLVGMLHATIVLQFYEGGDAYAVGWLGVLNGTRIPEDMAVLKSLTDQHFARHDKDPAIYRRLIMKGTEDTVQKYRRKPDDSGVSFYGPPVFPRDVARSYRFVSELFEQFTSAYLELVAKRAGQPHTPADLLAQEDMRKRWLVDQLFSDPFSSKLVPFEVWSLANVPPVIRF